MNQQESQAASKLHYRSRLTRIIGEVRNRNTEIGVKLEVVQQKAKEIAKETGDLKQTRVLAA
jgi:hypothetical protein